MENKKYSFNEVDLKQIGIKFLMIAIAAVLPEVIEQMKLIDFGQYQNYATGAIFLLQYAGQRFISGK